MVKPEYDGIEVSSLSVRVTLIFRQRKYVKAYINIVFYKKSQDRANVVIVVVLIVVVDVPIIEVLVPSVVVIVLGRRPQHNVTASFVS